MPASRRYRAGESLEDYCRACKTDRLHTVMAADSDGRPIRVVCGYCGSEHNFRGGPRVDPSPAAGSARIASLTTGRSLDSPQQPARTRSSREPFPLVSDRERTAPPMSINDQTDLELLLRRIIREEAGVTPVAPSEKWRDGTLILRPGTPGMQEKTWPIETFFHKVVMIRNRLRTLEQQVNASDMPDALKVRLQSYISGCYGSLTSFNVLFAEDDDQFKGSGGE